MSHYRIYQISANPVNHEPEDLYHLAEADDNMTSELYDFFGEKITDEESIRRSLAEIGVILGGLAVCDTEKKHVRFAPREAILARTIENLRSKTAAVIDQLEEHGWLSIHALRNALINPAGCSLFYDEDLGYTITGYELLDNALQGMYPDGLFIGGIYDAHR